MKNFNYNDSVIRISKMAMGLQNQICSPSLVYRRS